MAPETENAPVPSVGRQQAEAIVRRLRQAGHEAYFVGGCVRDMVMRLETADYDIATSARPEEIVSLFPHTRAVGAQFGVVLVIEGGRYYEVATFRADGEPLDGRRPASVTFCGMEEDVKRRDFTINGMMYDPLEQKVIDLTGGRRDIRDKIIRAIGDPHERFQEDKLRLLRAIRFASRFDYAIEEATFTAICHSADQIAAVSPERIGEEILKMLTSPHAGRGMRLMHDVGLLRVVLPEVEATVGVDQPPEFHPEGDVFTHTCEMLDMLEAPTRSLALGALLHDIGKPPTMDVADRIRFNEHAPVGANMARSVCRRLRCSAARADQVVALVGNHMRFMNVGKMKLSTLKRLLALPSFEEHLELHRLDCLASHGKLDHYDLCLQKLNELSADEIRPPRLVTGEDLIALGYAPGPVFSQILDAVEEAQLEGEIAARDEAIALIEARFPLLGRALPRAAEDRKKNV